jgi:uncharacterized phage infection (PIP) family protein YhgE
MARSKKKSPALEKARKRLAGIESINPNLNLGNGLTANAYRTLINQLEANLKAYNIKLSEADELLNNVLAGDAELAEFSDRMLKAVGAVYGLDSNEYEKAGGTRKSERKKPGPPSNTGEDATPS